VGKGNFTNVQCVRKPEILVEQQPPQGVLVCDHAGLVINKFSPLTPTLRLTIKLTIKLSQAATVAFSWTLTPGLLFDASIALLQTTGGELRIPADSLLPGASYHLQLDGRLDSGEASTASRVFTLGFSDLVAAIAGGSRTVSRSDGATLLDASGSLDPDVCPPSSGSDCADTALTFEWSCFLPDGAPCRLRATNEVLY